MAGVNRGASEPACWSADVMRNRCSAAVPDDHAWADEVSNDSYRLIAS